MLAINQSLLLLEVLNLVEKMLAALLVVMEEDGDVRRVGRRARCQWEWWRQILKRDGAMVRRCWGKELGMAVTLLAAQERWCNGSSMLGQIAMAVGSPAVVSARKLSTRTVDVQ